MVDRAREPHGRSIGKAVSWRILGTLDTFLVTLLVTGSFKWAGSIASVESISKIVLFYLHERAWFRFGWSARGEAGTRPFAVRAGKLLPWTAVKLAIVPTSSHLPEETPK